MHDPRRREWLARSALPWLAAGLSANSPTARAQILGGSRARTALDLRQLAVQRSDDGLLLDYEVRIDLTTDLEMLLNRGIAVVFVAEAELFRNRWYWVDQSRAVATRRWRVAYQPLTRHWRLTYDGLSRHYNRLADALDILRRASQWRIADPLPLTDAQDHYVDFSFKVDATELPRPLQIGLGGGLDGPLTVERRVSVPLPR